VGGSEHREGDERVGGVEAESATGKQPDLGVDLFDPGVAGFSWAGGPLVKRRVFGSRH
jgi:hypothetical protein